MALGSARLRIPAQAASKLHYAFFRSPEIRGNSTKSMNHVKYRNTLPNEFKIDETMLQIICVASETCFVDAK